MEETRKRENDDGVVHLAPRKVRAEGDDGDDVMKWMIAGESEEFTADELMKLLEDEDGGEPSVVPAMATEDSSSLAVWRGSGFRVRFIEDPYAMPVIFQSSSSPGYITINGNEESCGSSFSDSDATVMASVDARGLLGFAGCFTDRGGAWGISEAEARERGGRTSTDAFEDGNDDLLARFLGEEEEDCD